MSLLENTENLLRQRVEQGMTLREIAANSAGTVELQWLYRFARGEIPSPGVKPVQALHDCLAKLTHKSAA